MSDVRAQQCDLERGKTMKTPEEIRRHRDHLRICIKMPCECRGTVHAEKCVRGMYMMKSTMETLSWALGENDDMQGLVDRMARDVAEFLRSN